MRLRALLSRGSNPGCDYRGPSTSTAGTDGAALGAARNRSVLIQRRALIVPPLTGPKSVAKINTDNRKWGLPLLLILSHRTRRTRRCVAHALCALLYSPGGLRPACDGCAAMGALRNRAIPPEKTGERRCRTTTSLSMAPTAPVN